MKMDFYQYLNFGLGNEDWKVEEQALQVNAGDRVVCVTASGDRSMHLLMTDCREVVSIDMNPIQNYLLELKLAALNHLEYEPYLAFLGCLKSPHRLSLFDQIKNQLSPQALAFWINNKKMITKGVIYQGRIERLTALTSLFFKTVSFRKVATLFSLQNLEEQKQYVSKHWDKKSLRKFFEWAINPRFLSVILNDPGLNSFIDYTSKPGTYIYERMIRYLNYHLAKDSILLQLLFTGKIQAQSYLPYLTFEGYQKIKNNTYKLQIKTDNISHYLNKSDGQAFDAFSLSDIASYMPQSAFENLLHGIFHSANSNASFCIREFMSNRQIPFSLSPHFQRDQQLEQKLEKEETNFVYRFMVGKIIH